MFPQVVIVPPCVSCMELARHHHHHGVSWPIVAAIVLAILVVTSVVTGLIIWIVEGKH